MKYVILFFVFFSLTFKSEGEEKMKYRKLLPEEEEVIINKGTETPFSGEYDDHWRKGVYRCKRCASPLYRWKDKFKSHRGWPSFDDEIEGAVKRLPDRDGKRTEIVCAKCGAHLGHVFFNEGFTDKNIRHCVNSISLLFEESEKTKSLIVGGGCFWGVEYYMKRIPGVLNTEVGYSGGKKTKPRYEEVCSGETGHAEVVRIEYDSKLVSFRDLAKRFFEIHDPTQKNGQGPDRGSQYRSIVFYDTEEEKKEIEKLIEALNKNGFDVKTEVSKMKDFWKGEDYHQDYYDRKGALPYCHVPVKRFE